MKNNRFFKYLGTFLFSIGILFAFTLLSVMIWGDLEASLFSSSMDADKYLSSLRCPIFLSPNETGYITAKFTNPTDQDWERYTRAFISEGFVSLMRELKIPVPVPAGGEKTMTWEVFPEDAAYNRIIFFRVYVNAKYPYPDSGGSCGIIMVDFLGMKGQQIFLVALLTTAVLSLIGLVVWRLSLKPSDPEYHNNLNSRYILSLILAIGIVISYFGVWVIALIFLAIGILMIGIIIGRYVSPSI